MKKIPEQDRRTIGELMDAAKLTLSEDDQGLRVLTIDLPIECAWGIHFLAQYAGDLAGYSAHKIEFKVRGQLDIWCYANWCIVRKEP